MVSQTVVFLPAFTFTQNAKMANFSEKSPLVNSNNNNPFVKADNNDNDLHNHGQDSMKFGPKNPKER